LGAGILPEPSEKVKRAKTAPATDKPANGKPPANGQPEPLAKIDGKEEAPAAASSLDAVNKGTGATNAEEGRAGINEGTGGAHAEEGRAGVAAEVPVAPAAPDASEQFAGGENASLKMKVDGQ
jgi:hypothetical protein